MSIEIKKKMNEFRKAHFFMGFENENRTTNYKDDYIMKSCDKGFPNTEEAKHFELYIANPRKAHFDLGEDKINYQSMAKFQFGLKKSDKAQLSEETQKDLRSHHFKLGFHSVPSETEYSQYSTQPIEQQNQQHVNIRKHHHDFGDPNTYFTTSYQLQEKDAIDYHLERTKNINNPDKKSLINTLSTDQLTDLRKQHFTYGSSQINYLTHNAEYGTKQGPPNKLAEGLQKDLRQHHFSEDGERQYQTTYNAMHSIQ